MTPEATILSSCKSLLTLLKNQRRLTFRRIHVMPVLRGQGKKKFATPNTDMLGMTDLMVFLKGGKTLHIECKSEKGVLSLYQKAWREDLTEMGHEYHIVRCLDELIEILSAHGITTWAFPRQEKE